MFAEEEAALLLAEPWTPAELEAAMVRREAGEPLEQILGWAGFDGLRIRLLPGVFVPRQRSVLLVDEAVRRLAGMDFPVVVDVGCGSGALGAAVCARCPSVTVWGIDMDPDAVACARINLEPSRVMQGDLLDAVPADLAGGVDVLLANLPYVPSGQIAMMPPEARDHEHRVALDGGSDGLDHHRRLLAGVGGLLRPGGCVLIECGVVQVEALTVVMLAAGLGVEVVADDETGGCAVVGTTSVEAGKHQLLT